jgi:hypothetical protein
MIRIRVKSAERDDRIFEFSDFPRVSELKMRISEELDGNPDPILQKIIYLGKILEDHYKF